MATPVGNFSVGTWTAGANWSTGSPPAAGDNPIIESGTVDVTTSYPGATAGVDYDRFVVRELYSGKLATAGSPFYIGSVTHPIYYAGRNCQAYLAIDVGKSSTIDVLATRMMLDALVLSGEGTWAEVAVHEANRATIATGATVTMLRLVGAGANVDVQAGVSLASLSIDAGSVSTKSVASTRADVGGNGSLEITSTSTATAPLITLAGGAALRLNCANLTITNLYVYPGAAILWNGNQLGANTITNLYVYGEGKTIQLPPNITVTNLMYRPIRNS